MASDAASTATEVGMGAATGAAAGGPVGALIGGLAPLVSMGLGSLFGLNEPSAQEREAARLQEESLRRMREAASGVGPSPAQQAAAAARERAQQQLASLAQKGSVQQQAGNVRAAMQATPEIMARIGGAEAQARAEEMARARDTLSYLSANVAAQQAAAGRQQREYQQRLLGAGVQAAGGIVGAMYKGGGGGGKLTPEEISNYNELHTRGMAPGATFAAAPAARAPAPAAATPAAAAAPGMTPQQVKDAAFKKSLGITETSYGAEQLGAGPTATSVPATSLTAAPAQAPVTVGTTPAVAPQLGKTLPSAGGAARFLGRLYDGDSSYMAPGLGRRRY